MTEPDWALMVAIMKFLEVTLAGAGRRNLGSPRRPPAFYALENDGVAGIRLRDQTG